MLCFQNESDKLLLYNIVNILLYLLWIMINDLDIRWTKIKKPCRTRRTIFHTLTCVPYMYNMWIYVPKYVRLCLLMQTCIWKIRWTETNKLTIRRPLAHHHVYIIAYYYHIIVLFVVCNMFFFNVFRTRNMK